MRMCPYCYGSATMSERDIRLVCNMISNTTGSTKLLDYMSIASGLRCTYTGCYMRFEVYDRIKCSLDNQTFELMEKCHGSIFSILNFTVPI